MTADVPSDPPPSATAGPSEFASDDARYHSLGQALTRIKQGVEAQIGDEDVQRLLNLNRISRGLEAVGRLLIHVSPEPVSFSVGVGCLFVHKQLQTTEIGHTVLHGAYDRLEGAEAFHSSTFRWDFPVDETSWRAAHNIEHHQYTNVARRDVDINFGGIRLTEQTPHRVSHYTQLAGMFLVSWPWFGHAINMHVTGMLDVYGRQGWVDQYDVIDDTEPATVREVHRRALGKMLPYLAKEYVLFPALAGPFFWKVMLGNFLSERMRDLYTAATIYCGHVGPAVASYPEGTRAGSRGRWYAMQVEASNNFDVARPLHLLCGGLEHQIEHHLFPRLPPARLREIAPEVQRVCQEHGVTYRRAPWGQTLRQAVAHVARLSLPAAGESGWLGGARSMLRAMA